MTTDTTATAAGTGRRALTPHALVYGTAAAVDPQVSPDGTRLVYGVARAAEDKPAETPQTRLWTSALDGSGAEPLTEESGRPRLPRWSPDGTRIAYVANTGEGDDEGSAILLVDAGGGASQTLARHPLGVGWLEWSPAGDRLAYSVAVDPEPATAGPDPLVRVTRRVDYKDDVRGYLGDRREQVFVLDTAGGDPVRLSCEPVDHWSPTWSPDGQRLAYRVEERAATRSWLRIERVDGSNAIEVFATEEVSVSLFAWSPSGDRILVVAEPGPTAQPDLFLVETRGGAVTRLTDDLPVMPERSSPPRWLDSRSVLLHAVRQGASNLYRFDVESRELEPLTDWRAEHAGLSTDRDAVHVVQVRSDLSSLGEIAVWDRRSGALAVVTHLNDELFASFPPARWERFDLERGGFTIEGWLFFPPEFDASRRYPLILDVHGGPHGHHGYGFHSVVELLATHGYLVLIVNPRGSATYGRAFADAVVGDWGGEDWLDLLAALDLVAAREYVDPDRLGICGYSYGGYMTSWAIGQTDRFKAAVCGAPCFNLTSDYGTSDMGPYWDPIEFGVTPWEDPDWYREHSPSTFAHRATTPTLIIHGEADSRCAIGQGEEMFATLMQAGCETEFVRYPGASHGFTHTGKVGQREDFLARWLEWFQRHL